METKLLDGKWASARLKEKVAKKVSRSLGRPPSLGVVLVGQDPASMVYVAAKERACHEVGIDVQVKRLPSTATQNEIEDLVRSMGNDPDLDGILVQLPLPKGIDTERVVEAITPHKDVDGFHPENLGLLARGRPRFLPCTPAGIVDLLKMHGVGIAGKRCVIVGRSLVVGKPLALLMLMEDATVTVCHSKTKPLEKATRQADILVVAAGVPCLIGREHVGEGTVVVDVGVHRTSDPKLAELAGGERKLGVLKRKGTALVGDVRQNEIEGLASWRSPVPGGVGPMTIAKLLENTVKAWELRERN